MISVKALPKVLPCRWMALVWSIIRARPEICIGKRGFEGKRNIGTRFFGSSLSILRTMHVGVRRLAGWIIRQEGNKLSIVLISREMANSHTYKPASEHIETFHRPF